jgi:glucose/arabinose dehydrogenase
LTGERGLLGIAFDPRFAANRYLYVYYTMPAMPSRAPYNRIVSFTADPHSGLLK